MMRQVRHNNEAMKLLWVFLKLFCVFSKNSFFNFYAYNNILSIFWLSSFSVNNIIVIHLMPKESKIKLDIFINFEKLLKIPYTIALLLTLLNYNRTGHECSICHWKTV